MPGRFHGAPRCARCRLHESLCLCALIPTLETRTRVVLVIHRFEDRKPTNTGRLATECLTNSEVMVRGDGTRSREMFQVREGSLPLLLFPLPGALPIERFRGSESPITLVVPDGTWRQAGKVHKRVPGLAGVPSVALPPGERSGYRLRTAPHEAGLSTLEAIARALGVLEGPDVQQALLHVFRAMVQRTLWARGAIRTLDVTSGIPQGAKRHDPTSGLARR